MPPAPPTASRWPADGSKLDRLDKRLSKPVFTLQLGLVLETALAYPGCFFGMPAFCVPGTLVLGLTVGDDDGRSADWCVASAMLAGLVATFSACLFATGGIRYTKVLYGPPTVVLAPWAALALLRWMEAAAADAGTACFYLVSWYVVIAPILVVKSLSRRRRPIVCSASHVGEACVEAASRKALTVIPRMLRHDANAAFPSGDVAGAVCWAFPLWRAGLRLLPVSAVALSAFGRMYWQAHHAMDVLVGGVAATCACALLEAALGHTSHARWYHLLGAQVAVVALVKALKYSPPDETRAQERTRGKARHGDDAH